MSDLPPREPGEEPRTIGEAYGDVEQELRNLGRTLREILEPVVRGVVDGIAAWFSPDEEEKVEEKVEGWRDVWLTDANDTLYLARHVAWRLCKDGTLWEAGDPAHAGPCPDCVPLYVLEEKTRKR